MGIIVDNFAGGGGASTAMEEALGRNVDIAINHDADAIAMHKRNHPNTKHYCESVWDVDPTDACSGQSVDIAWFSPDCKHFSRAAGGTPKNQKIRGLAWVVLKWAGLPEWQRPKIIYLENVSEFQTWQPITKRGKIDKRYAKGSTFRKWEKQLQSLGYDTKYGILCADDFGAPTIRKRLFFVARCDGLPIVWPQATHGDPKKDPLGVLGLKPWKPASSIIDWSVPCKSIFERKKPLADNTLRRIAAGLKKFVIDNPDPFIIKPNHKYKWFRGQSIHEPLQTVTAVNDKILVAPIIDRQFGTATGDSNQNDITQPLGAVTAGGGGKSALITPTLVVMGYGEKKGQKPRIRSLDDPLHTVTAGGKKAAIAVPYLEEFYTNRDSGHSLEKPIGTILSKEKHACVAPIIQHVAHSKAKVGCMPADEPMRTITATPKGGSLALTTAFIAQHNTGVVGRDADAPLSSVTATGSQQQPVTVMLGQDHREEVTAFLMKYYGNEKNGCDIEEPLHTVTSKDRFGLITVHGKQYRIVDICMRMLTGRELFNAMDFPPDYDIMEGKLTKTSIVAKAGNAVCKAPAKALVRANSAPYMGPKLRVAA